VRARLRACSRIAAAFGPHPTGALDPGAPMIRLLSKERIFAPAGFNRWWNVAAAVAINLCIGQAYAFSVFNLPLRA
jgi:hypothetical protein